MGPGRSHCGQFTTRGDSVCAARRRRRARAVSGGMTCYSRCLLQRCRAPLARLCYLSKQAKEVSLSCSPHVFTAVARLGCSSETRIARKRQWPGLRELARLRKAPGELHEHRLRQRAISSSMLHTTDLCCAHLTHRTTSHETRTHPKNARAQRQAVGLWPSSSAPDAQPSRRTVPRQIVRRASVRTVGCPTGSTTRAHWAAHHTTTADGTARKPRWASPASRTPRRRRRRRNKRRLVGLYERRTWRRRR